MQRCGVASKEQAAGQIQEEAQRMNNVIHPRFTLPHPSYWGVTPISRLHGYHVSGLSGLGTDPQGAQLAQQVGSIAASGITGALTAANLAGVISISAATIPVIGAAIAGVALAISAILNSGCGQSCIVTSNWANQAEQKLIQNIQAYFALPSPRSQTAQNVALLNFDNVWSYLSQQCGQAALSTAGVDCTKDRARGSCKWKQTTNSPLLQFPNEPQPGACWNWFNGYRDPIAMDPAVPDSQAVPATDSTGTGTTTSLFGSLDPNLLLLIGGGLILTMGLAKS